MKHIYVLVLCMIVIVNGIQIDKAEDTRVRKVFLKKRAHKLVKNATGNATNSTNGTGVATIPFGPAANLTSETLNSVGELVKESVTLTTFPFTVARCDNIIIFPCAYINDISDYRVRKPAYMEITAHYANLYADKDGQKLIQQVLASQVKSVPKLLKGAEGCVLIDGDRGQKAMRVCADGLSQATNILQVFKDFSRCRMGDNLQPIPETVLKTIMSDCHVDKEQIMSKPGEEFNPRSGKISNSGLLKPKIDEDALNQVMQSQKERAKYPKFQIPIAEGNPWEQQRLEYFQPGVLTVPGDKVKVKFGLGIQPGLNPAAYPGVEPVKAGLQ